MRVIVVEDQRLFRQLVVKMCAERFDVVGEAASGGEALAICREERPDLLFLDLKIPAPDGVTVAETLIKEQPALRVLAVSAKLDTVTVFRLLQSGVHGYVSKYDDDLPCIGEALSALARGQPYFSQAFDQVQAELKRDPEAFYKILSERELELLPLFSEGFDDQNVAARLGLSAATVRWHRRNIMKKLEIHATPDLMRYGIQHGFWDPGRV